MNFFQPNIRSLGIYFVSHVIFSSYTYVILFRINIRIILWFAKWTEQSRIGQKIEKRKSLNDDSQNKQLSAVWKKQILWENCWGLPLSMHSSSFTYLYLRWINRKKEWKMSMTLQNLPKQFYKLLKKIRRSKIFRLWVQITFIFSLLCSKIMMSSEAHAQHIQSNWNEIRPETTAAWKGVPHMSSKSSEI